MVCIQSLEYYFNKFLGHFCSPQKSNDPEAVISSEATTNVEAIENNTVFNMVQNNKRIANFKYSFPITLICIFHFADIPM